MSVDYGFVGERTGDDAEADAKRTILVVKVEGCGAIMARCVKGKGRADPLQSSGCLTNCAGWAWDKLSFRQMASPHSAATSRT